ncbi:hypothetical protein GGI05_004210 [Coemansia sp. RSA 2603]|nr:hypothetical protein GGI05_004210 [Coemansia sp. RSA 2603]
MFFRRFGPPLFASLVGAAVAVYTFTPYLQAEREQQQRALREIDSHKESTESKRQ